MKRAAPTEIRAHQANRLRRPRAGAKQAAGFDERSKVVGSNAATAPPRKRDVRRVAPPDEGGARLACRGRDFLLKPHQRRRLDDSSERDAAFHAAEIAETGRFKLKIRRVDAGQKTVQILKQSTVDVAKEGERHMHVFVRRPSRAGQAFLNVGHPIGDGFRDGERKKTTHAVA